MGWLFYRIVARPCRGLHTFNLSSFLVLLIFHIRSLSLITVTTEVLSFGVFERIQKSTAGVVKMFRAAITVAFLGASAYAQTRVVPLLLLDTDPQALVASVISANPSTTEYLVGCPTGVDSNDCGYNPPETIKHAGSVFAGSLTAPEEQFTMSWECTVQASDAVCTTSAGGAQANFPGTGTTTLAGVQASYVSVTVTAGVDQLGPEPTTTSGVYAATSGVVSATANSAPTAGVGLGLAGIAAVAWAL